MARRIPKYRHFKPKNLAVARVEGRDHYLGRYDSAESWEKYYRLLAEHSAKVDGGRFVAEAPSPPLTVFEVAARYLRFARQYYRKDGRPTRELDAVREAIRPLCSHYGRTPAAEFGPKRLKAVRGAMVDSGKLSRGVINRRVGRMKRMFKWAVAEELVPPTVHQALTAVEGLRKGRTAAPDRPPVKPVDDPVVDATILQLPKVVADMVRIQRLTGCRPAEVCMVRPCDIDRSEAVWRYRPESHKTEHHSRERVIFIGPEAQTVVMPYLLRPADQYCFSPIESEHRRSKERRENRQTPLTPSQARRRPKSRRRRPLVIVIRRPPTVEPSIAPSTRSIVKELNRPRRQGGNPRTWNCCPNGRPTAARISFRGR